jgi:type I restriction-modification system DNA methylase subunit
MYNSGLFAVGVDNDCDIIKIDGLIIKKLIGYLYESKDKQYIYNFDWIDADVLGQVYEQYLGNILLQSKSGKSRLKDGQVHKKEQGIYYTPTYVVDYIVRNTLVEALKNKKVNLEEIKVLDCACGSGSFLIKAFDYLYENLSLREESKQHKIDSQGMYSVKTEILKKNIYGVDLDNKAVEITKLNLLLKASEPNRKLPKEVDLHIKHGNSLVDDENIDKNAFDWKGDFQEGSFDILIGNPPYVFTRDVEFQGLFKDYVTKNYLNASESISKSHARQSGKVNLYSLFLIKGINLLKNHGLFGFIIPNNILRTTTYDIIRKFILNNCKILKIVDLGAGVFEGVTASTIILILEKENDKIKRDKNKVTIYPDINNLSDKKEVEQKGFLDNTSYAFNITLGKEGVGLFEEIEKDTRPLGEIATIHAGGIATGKNKKEMIENHPKNSKYKKMLEGKDIKPYYPEFANRYILYEKKLLYRARDESIFLSPEKLITQRISGGLTPLVISYDNQQFYTFNSTNTILLKDKSYPLKYILALLNSKLINWYYVNKFTNKSELTVNISKTFLEQLPIKIPFESQKQTIIEIVDKMLSLSKRLFEIGDKTTSETKELNDKIDSLNKEINKAVYQIYGLKDKDIESIEKI